MFKNLAGNDPLDQLKFMADQGFRAFEDNGMPRKDPQLQARIGDTLGDLGLEMGVFVANTNGFGQASFSSGDPAMRDQFLADMRTAVDVAKRKIHSR